MATAYELIVLALKDSGILADAETPDANMAADAFTTLQQMLAMWQIDKLYVYGMVENSLTPDGSVSYTIGSGGDGNFARPESIDYAFWRYNDIDYPLRLVATFEEYEGLCQKTQAGDPCLVYYEPSVTLGTLYVYPQPSNGTIRLVSKVRLPSLASTASTVTIPDEYLLPIRFSLAELLCVTFNAPANDALIAMARRARTMLKRSNVRVPELGMPSAVAVGVRADIFTG